MKKLFVIFFILIALLGIQKNPAYAIYDPLSLPNNKIGIHILFTSELQDAARLVNSDGGSWGYVTIPIQAGDRDLAKWQAFMTQARQLQVQPIIRLATENDYFNTGNWRKPTDADILDFANFLNSLTWPTANRYIIIFNEPNNANEWGGSVSPAEYATILSYAVSVFKSKSTDFYVISAGMDNAAADTANSMNEYEYLRAMNQAVPGIFNQIDGLGSHSYANPAFSSPPTANTGESISSFVYERSLVESLCKKLLPVFITETGWSRTAISDDTIAGYFQKALASVWSDNNIVAITPFLLHPNGSQFTMFSFLSSSGEPTSIYNAIFSLPKVKGSPNVTAAVLGDTAPPLGKLPLENFSKTSSQNVDEKSASISPKIFKTLAKWFLKIS